MWGKSLILVIINFHFGSIMKKFLTTMFMNIFVFDIIYRLMSNPKSS
jgi:hypothetical protein